MHTDSDRTPARHRQRLAGFGLVLTAAVALGAGAGAAVIYKAALAGPSPAATSSAASSPSGGTVTSVLRIGRVVWIGRGRIRVGGGPFPAVTALVTSTTRFTGSAQSLAQIHVGDSVALQIVESDGAARVVFLEDPVS